jgi:hypothetical protein
MREGRGTGGDAPSPWLLLRGAGLLGDSMGYLVCLPQGLLLRSSHGGGVEAWGFSGGSSFCFFGKYPDSFCKGQGKMLNFMETLNKLPVN